MITLKKSPKHGLQIKVQVENVLMLGEGGFVVGSWLIFLSKAVLHFDYLVFLKAIQVGPVSLRFVFLGLGLFSEKGPVIYAHIWFPGRREKPFSLLE